MHNCFKADELGDQRPVKRYELEVRSRRCGWRAAQETHCRQGLVGFHNWLDMENARERGGGNG